MILYIIPIFLSFGETFTQFLSKKEKPVISLKKIGYLGRLGNQMFQFASIYGIGRSLGYEAEFPIENCTTYQGGGPKDTKTGDNMKVKCDLLDCFNIPQRFYRPAAEITTTRTYQEGDFRFNPEVLSISDGTDFFGYFQTEKYFSHVRSEILDIFSFLSKHEEKANNFLRDVISKKADGKETVSLHVRRTDYTLYPGHHPTCTSEYYEKAISSFSPDSIIVIFSDDIEWCKSEFIGDRYIIVDLEDPYAELCLMTKCHSHIIANSSFSWWGAWLNTNPKKVVAPSNWFGPLLQKNTDDVYCKNWLIL
jgi:hypothetical protein